MVAALKHIIRNIPKIFRWLIGSIFIAPILIYVVVQYATNKPIELSQTNLLYLSLIILITVITSIIIGSMRSIKIMLNGKKTIDDNSQIVNKSNKIILPYSEITIGSYTTKDLCADIRAKIILDESNKPSIDIFLDRIRKGDPFCPNCLRPMDYLRASWMADGVQIGYQCKNCGIQHKGDFEDVLNDIKGEVRRNYENYWNTYKTEFDKLIKSNPIDYQLPKY